jgi:ribonuclease E
MEQDSAVAAETPATTTAASDGGDGSAAAAAPKTGAPRRRRRGGRGRGRGSGGAAKASSPAAEADGSEVSPASEAPAKTPAPRSRTPKPKAEPAEGTAAPKPRTPARPRTTAKTTAAKPKPEPESNGDGGAEAATAETSTTPRRRRRRGGRGRGGSSGAAKPTDAGADDEAEVEATAETQREEAIPDGSVATPATRSRRRGRRGSGATKKVAATTETKPDERPAAAPRTRRRTADETVAAGGPTRGLRSTRARTGRVGGRRRREETIVVPRIKDKVMVITEHGDRDQIAVLEEDVLVQHYVTRTGARSMVGNVYQGRVQNVLPGMEAAFIDVGRGRNGVLYAGEVNYSPEDLEGAAPRIEHVLKSGQAVLVQVTKDPMGGKGARLTAQISMPGRYLVFVPDANVSGISRRLPDEERKRLKAIMKKIRPEGHGIIVRTAAEGASEEALTDDLQRLIREWDGIQKAAKKAKAPVVIYEEPELTVRVVRDLFTDEEFKELVTDSPRVYDKVMEYVREIAPDLEPKVHLHQGKLPVFEEYRIVEQIHKALDKKVWLPSGGYLFIERTEAMSIIDVNTGKSVGKTNLEATVTNTNLEAAKEVARQLRLRDIGGIIVIDFIDMLLEQNKRQVEDTMKEALAVDKTRSQVFEIGPLGLMQVTRKRVSGGLVESFSETCPTCEGRGILINYEA